MLPIFMLDFSQIQMAIRMGTQNCTLGFNNLSYWIPI